MMLRKITKQQIYELEIEKLKREIEIAERQFNTAEEPFISAFTYNLLAKKELLNAVIKKAKESA
ncbi:MAG: hypothetical protein ACPLRZ_07765 [Thermovenabulum sp.]|uniref:hypothetical protein n=1 Tax=Thermovenabulum sp. TaxID=3100335 RepID=UPI003C7CB5B0